MWTVLLRPSGAPPANQPPTARFVADCAGEACDFDASTSSDPDDGIVSYQWEFGDGATGDGRITDHTYGVAGSYPVRLTVTDDAGETDTVEQLVDVGQPPSEVTFVGQATSNANSVAFAAGVPSGVQPGDLLVLFASQNTGVTLSGPGAGWTQLGRVVDGSHVTTGWWRVATDSDPGSVVRLSSGTTYTKVAMTLAAYRGLSQYAPIVDVAGAPEPGTSAAHTTPVLPNDTAGAWRVSYWSDKSSATTAWSEPAGECRRASTVGSGGGRIGALLTDSGRGLTAGTPTTTGALVATSNAATDKATTWTLLLRPSA
jgi:PKD repeat protein